ncbi:tautomerase family protein [Dyadobacter sp. NIV53]|uniref:tautomerase family protein n=1 Tax=Dyadobacter sp. NIV53 TaxID=2861765 RepID=UPI001C8645C9|nr:tautomerase family protein [Dyadobacter sp. NIV53]
MPQIKIYGLEECLKPKRELLSNVLHSCIVEAFKYPLDKSAHRFFYLDQKDFYYPQGRSKQYTIIEISLFEGRSIESKRMLYKLIFERFENEMGISANDIEITLTETPIYNWGIRGKSADELLLDYQIRI